MTTKDTDTHNPTPATAPLAIRLSEGLGLVPERAEFEKWASDQGFDVTPMDGFGLDFAGYRDLRTHGAWEGFRIGAAVERERIKAALIGMDDAVKGQHNYYAHAAWVLFERA